MYKLSYEPVLSLPAKKTFFEPVLIDVKVNGSSHSPL